MAPCIKHSTKKPQTVTAEELRMRPAEGVRGAAPRRRGREADRRAEARGLIPGGRLSPLLLWLSCEVREKVGCGYGFSEEVALVEHVATGCKEVGLLLGFDAFGNYFKPQVLCDGDDAFD